MQTLSFIRNLYECKTLQVAFSYDRQHNNPQHLPEAIFLFMMTDDFITVIVIKLLCYCKHSRNPAFLKVGKLNSHHKMKNDI
jgi:hypothetical protein